MRARWKFALACLGALVAGTPAGLYTWHLNSEMQRHFEFLLQEAATCDRDQSETRAMLLDCYESAEGLHLLPSTAAPEAFRLYGTERRRIAADLTAGRLGRADAEKALTLAGRALREGAQVLDPRDVRTSYGIFTEYGIANQVEISERAGRRILSDFPGQ